MQFGVDFSDLSNPQLTYLIYNAENMPIMIAHQTHGTTTFSYDGDGIRVKKAHGGKNTYYYDETLEVEKVGGQRTIIRYVFANGLRIAKLEGSTVNYYHKDHLGSSMVITDATGLAGSAFSYNYRPYGGERFGTLPLTKYKFTDQEFDLPVSITMEQGSTIPL